MKLSHNHKQRSLKIHQMNPVCQILQMTMNYILKKRVHGNYSLTGERVLNESDYKYIQIPNTLLNDMHINFCQYHLLQWFQMVNGFQDKTHGTTLTFSKVKHLFTQVLQNGKCHWVTVSTVRCKANEVKYFDSLAGPSMKAKISKQIANLLKTKQ